MSFNIKRQFIIIFCYIFSKTSGCDSEFTCHSENVLESRREKNAMLHATREYLGQLSIRAEPNRADLLYKCRNIDSVNVY